MEILITTIKVLLCGYCNYARGRDKMERGICAVLMALIVGAFSSMSAFETLVLFLLLWAGLVLGWGKYESVMHGENKRAEKDFLPADLVLKLFGWVKSEYVYGGIGTFVRYAVGFAPAIIFVRHDDFFLGVALSLLFGLFVAITRYIVGAVTRAYDEPISAAWSPAEAITGALLGIALVL